MNNTNRIMPERKFFGSGSGMYVKHLTTHIPALSRPLNKGEQYLGRFIVPPFQRKFVWTIKQQQKLIESIYLGLPIGIIIYNLPNVPTDTDFWLLDGQQRITTIIRYIDDCFPVNNYLYSQLPQEEQNHFDRMTTQVYQTQFECEEDCADIYNRLVYGGTPH